MRLGLREANQHFARTFKAVRAGKEVVLTDRLPTLDAIHVASAQLFAARLSIADLIFVSADQRQVDVAKAIGLAMRDVS